jgi:hypothetical protein
MMVAKPLFSCWWNARLTWLFFRTAILLHLLVLLPLRIVQDCFNLAVAVARYP